MSYLRYAVAVICVLAMLGCGESKQAQILRMARERAIRNRAAAKEEAERVTAQVVPKPKVEAKKDAPEEQGKERSESPPPKNAEKGNTQATLASIKSPTDVPPKSDDLAEPKLEAGNTSDQVAAPSSTIPRRDELLAFGRLGKQVAFVGSKQTIGVYDVASKTVLRQIYNPQLDTFSLVISDEGNTLAAGGVDGGLKIYSLENLDGLDKFQQNRFLRRDAPHPDRRTTDRSRQSL